MGSPRQLVSVGQRFGPAVVIVAETRRNRKRYATMRCDCGSTYDTLIAQLMKGTADRCRCASREAVKAARQRPEDKARVLAQARSNGPVTARSNTRYKTTHGLSHTHPLYNTWSGIMNRCYNPKQRAYPDYGGRGITVCERWHDVRNFVADIEAEIGPKPGKGHAFTLDRVDNEGNYEPGNVQWATGKQQAANRRPDRNGLAAKRIAELEARVEELKAEVARLKSSQSTGRCS